MRLLAEQLSGFQDTRYRARLLFEVETSEQQERMVLNVEPGVRYLHGMDDCLSKLHNGIIHDIVLKTLCLASKSVPKSRLKAQTVGLVPLQHKECSAEHASCEDCKDVHLRIRHRNVGIDCCQFESVPQMIRKLHWVIQRRVVSAQPGKPVCQPYRSSVYQPAWGDISPPDFRDNRRAASDSVCTIQIQPSIALAGLRLAWRQPSSPSAGDILKIQGVYGLLCDINAVCAQSTDLIDLLWLNHGRPSSLRFRSSEGTMACIELQDGPNVKTLYNEFDVDGKAIEETAGTFQGTITSRDSLQRSKIR
ncbi:hypothetical protein QFC22_002977 [Naganishia vaughanmartiniae]|uniref:Uncharacterized protein n=1 Tax=Naganishia vaughanmartiniae TaxID=1424756 RepID=A0ACC2X9J0_9TREE|nr:hypothetical protein QFC22_002977 [Naganishia vaughanmartiniae]